MHHMWQENQMPAGKQDFPILPIQGALRDNAQQARLMYAHLIPQRYFAIYQVPEYLHYSNLILAYV